MNKLKNRKQLEEIWQKMPSENKAEFQDKYGVWSSLSYHEKISYVGAYVAHYKQKKKEDDYITIFQKSIKPLENKISGLTDENKAIKEELRNKEYSSIEDSKANIQKADTVNMSKNQPNNLESNVGGKDFGGDNTPNIYAPTSSSMDCDYAENGPKNCIFIETTKDGPYGRCIKAQRAKKLKVLPWAITNVLDKVGCPSNPVFFKCDYLKKDKIKI